jgi:hypothetical protein
LNVIGHLYNEWKRYKMQVVNTKTQTTITKQNNSTLFQDEENLGKFLHKLILSLSNFLLKIPHHHQCQLV